MQEKLNVYSAFCNGLVLSRDILSLPVTDYRTTTSKSEQTWLNVLNGYDTAKIVNLPVGDGLEVVPLTLADGANEEIN